jgi:hypothetical protein
MDYEECRLLGCGAVVIVWTDVSEESIASIFRVEKSASEEPAWAGSFRLSYQSKQPAISYIVMD